MLCAAYISAKANIHCLIRRDIVPLGQNKSNFNYNLDEKRVLNFENVVDDSDNVKQDMSIDVYGRKTDEDEQTSDEVAPDTSDVKVCAWKQASMPPKSPQCCHCIMSTSPGIGQASGSVMHTYE